MINNMESDVILAFHYKGTELCRFTVKAVDTVSKIIDLDTNFIYFLGSCCKTTFIAFFETKVEWPECDC